MGQQFEVDTEGGSVLDFQGALERRRQVDAEVLAEVARMLPILRKMIAERDVLMGAQGCPVMKGIFGVVD